MVPNAPGGQCGQLGFFAPRAPAGSPAAVTVAANSARTNPTAPGKFQAQTKPRAVKALYLQVG